MDVSARILDAAKRIYAKHGFRGATTRLIAIEAGVNEVTLFRTFGSKGALFDALLHSHVAEAPMPTLPGEPGDAVAEITAWAEALLSHMRANRSLMRTTIGELEERPDAAVSMCEGPNCAAMLLTDYVLRLQTMGAADDDADIQTAVAMFMSSLFGDALYRDVLPNAFPDPASEAPERYVRTFLRSLGVRRDDAQRDEDAAD